MTDPTVSAEIEHLIGLESGFRKMGFTGAADGVAWALGRIGQLERELRELREKGESSDRGYKRVPVEPTNEMILAGIKVAGVSIGEADDIYRAMLEAAPKGEP